MARRKRAEGDSIGEATTEDGVPKTKKRRGGRKRKTDGEATVVSAAASPADVNHKIRIVCIFHRDHPIDESISDPSIYLPIFGGKALYNGHSPIAFMQGDDTGDNISRMNPHLNEMTVMYWVWKHYDEIGNPEFIGFNHYNRFIEWSDEDLSENTILARVLDLGEDSVYGQYKKGHVSQDLDKFSAHLKEDVLSANGALLRTYDRFMRWHKMYTNNIFIMPRKAFFEFMERFMSKCIDICVKMIADNEIDLQSRDSYQRRAYGFILERMTSFYIYYMTTLGGYHIKTVERKCVGCV